MRDQGSLRPSVEHCLSSEVSILACTPTGVDTLVNSKTLPNLTAVFLSYRVWSALYGADSLGYSFPSTDLPCRLSGLMAVRTTYGPRGSASGLVGPEVFRKEGKVSLLLNRLSFSFSFFFNLVVFTDTENLVFTSPLYRRAYISLFFEFSTHTKSVSILLIYTKTYAVTASSHKIPSSTHIKRYKCNTKQRLTYYKPGSHEPPNHRTSLNTSNISYRTYNITLNQ